MRTADFRFYGDLEDFLPEKASLLRSYAFWGTPAVRDAIEALGVPHPEVGLLLVDDVPSAFERRLVGGERVAVYPRTTVLELGAAALAPPFPSPPRFVLDVHLGKLAGYLRLLGLDVRFDVGADDAALARRSSCEGRILLTRDVGLLKRKEVVHGAFVRSTAPEAQLRETVRRFALERNVAPFTRCMRCNGLLVEVPAESARARVPPRVAARHTCFRGCSGCGRLYWEGTHHARLKALVHAMQSPLAGGE